MEWEGVQKKGFVAFLKDIVCECGIDFIGIQETMLKTFTVSFLRHLECCGNFK
jgi:hypothetical protein